MSTGTLDTSTLGLDVRRPSPKRPPLSAPSTPLSLDASSLPRGPFTPDASIVLTGIRGAGKSTLAIIASAAMKRRIVDAEKLFFELNGLSSLVWKKTHGGEAYAHQQTHVLEHIFCKHRTNAVIVCSWMERTVQTLLRSHGAVNPIIYVVREADAIRNHWRAASTNNFDDILDASAIVLRTCTHYEFFNVSEGTQLNPGAIDRSRSASIEPEQRHAVPHLTLKRTERHFLKFLSLLLPSGTIPFAESAFPLALVPAENRRFTYAVSIPLSAFLDQDLDIQDLETGADAIELIVDDLCIDSRSPTGQNMLPSRATEISSAMARIRRDTVIPIIFHVAFPERAATDEIWEALYLAYVYHGLRLAPEYVTVDLRLNQQRLLQLSPLKGSSKFIGNLQVAGQAAPPWSHGFWLAHYEIAQSVGCDLARFVRPADDMTDNFAIRAIFAAVDGTKGHNVPLIAYNSGPLGRNSACFNQLLTSVAPPELLGQAHAEAELAAVLPSMTALMATHALSASFIYDRMRLYVFGAKVDYSLSPIMHNTALEALGMPHHYTPHSTPSLDSVKPLIADPYFAGASVGLPFKVRIISLTDSLSRHAQAIGAVNTLLPVRRLNQDGSIPEENPWYNDRNRAGPVKALYGENTDWIGIRACIRRGLSPANAVRAKSCGLVIGAGGMARATVYAMLQLGVQSIVVYNRTLANAEGMVSHFWHLLHRSDPPLFSPESRRKTKFHIILLDEPWPSQYRYPTMVVSCIPTHSIGNDPAPNFTLPATWLGSPTGGVLVELAYKTLTTPLLEQIRRLTHKGWVTMDGLDLLPEQGFAQFELFTGRRAPRRLMRRQVVKSHPDIQSDHDQAPARVHPRLSNIVEQDP